MTRDEAIDIWVGTYPNRSPKIIEQAGTDVDRFVLLGMLTLDKPDEEKFDLAAHKKAVAAIQALPDKHKGHHARILGALARAGLKVVERAP